MHTKLILIVALALACEGCRGQASVETEAIRIERFDKALLRLVEAGDDVGIQGEMLCDFTEMLDVVAKGVFNMQSTEAEGFFDRLVNYYSEPNLLRLYREAVAAYDSVGDVEQQLAHAFARLKECLPAMPVPHVYMHVSGFRQNVLTADNLLSISIDRYMGVDYPLYRDFFHPYQREKMLRERVAPDMLTGWLMSEYPFDGREAVLLDRIIYEGKIRYLVARALPDAPQRLLMGYTERDLEWCRANEPELWKTIIKRRHLYTPDLLTTEKYLDDAPATFLADNAPGALGVWIGWQIVRRYADVTNSSPEDLMRNTDAQDILTKSRYKP
jgi:hypothetical protein